MSRITVGVLFASLALILAATWFNALFVARGSGAVLIIALAYSYIVARRENGARLSDDAALS